MSSSNQESPLSKKIYEQPSNNTHRLQESAHGFSLFPACGAKLSGHEGSLFTVMSFLGVLSLLVGLGLHLGGTSAAAQAPLLSKPIVFTELSDSKCHTFPLKARGPDFLGRKAVPAPVGWCETGYITEDAILLPDFTFGTMRRMSGDGFVEDQPSTNGITAPLYVYPRPEGGYLLLDVFSEKEDPVPVEDIAYDRGEIHYVNVQGEVEREVWARDFKVSYGASGKERWLIAVTRMIPYGNGLIVSADISEDHTGAEWRRAFGYLEPPENGGDHKGVGRFLPFDTPDVRSLSQEPYWAKWRALKEKYYNRDFQFMAVIEDEFFLLVMEEEPWIGKVDLAGMDQAGEFIIRRFADVPEDYAQNPLFKTDTDFRSRSAGVLGAFSTYRSIEESKMPAGLYAFGERLFLLVKSAAGAVSGRTDWFLIEIALENGRARQRYRLPTHSQHISIVRGSDNMLGLIEKGGVGVLDAYPRRALFRSASDLTIFHLSWLLSGQNAPGKDRTGCHRYP